MIPLSLAEVAGITGGTLDPRPAAAAVVTGPVVIDSRRAEPGALFAALPGEHVDGHEFAAAAVAAAPSPCWPRARCRACPRSSSADVTAALGALARAVAGRLPGVTVAGDHRVVGQDLDQGPHRPAGRAPRPRPSPPRARFNNEIGLPLTVLRADARPGYLVLEMAARGPGHIAALCDIAPPRIGAVLNVGRAHAGEFGSLDAIAKAKGELVEALPRRRRRRS